MSVCNKPEDALHLLRTSPAFHLVILDVQPRDNDSFKLLETISLEMEMPVVLGELRLGSTALGTLSACGGDLVPWGGGRRTCKRADAFFPGVRLQ